MKLWLKAHFFIAALLVSCLADEPTKEECEPLIKAQPVDNISEMTGRVNLLLGISDQHDFKVIMNLTDSYWGNMTVSPSNSKEVVIDQMDRINGSCISSTMKMVFENDTARVSLPNMTLDYQFLSCKGCVLALVKSSATNLKKLLQDFGVKPVTDIEEVTGRALYLMANEMTVTDSHLEHFNKTAHCLGFTGEPDFHYNPEKSFCKEGEGTTYKID